MRRAYQNYLENEVIKRLTEVIKDSEEMNEEETRKEFEVNDEFHEKRC